jgi:hypothetical protein
MKSFNKQSMYSDHIAKMELLQDTKIEQEKKTHPDKIQPGNVI